MFRSTSEYSLASDYPSNSLHHSEDDLYDVVSISTESTFDSRCPSWCSSCKIGRTRSTSPLSPTGSISDVSSISQKITHQSYSNVNCSLIKEDYHPEQYITANQRQFAVQKNNVLSSRPLTQQIYAAEYKPSIDFNTTYKLSCFQGNQNNKVKQIVKPTFKTQLGKGKFYSETTHNVNFKDPGKRTKIHIPHNNVKNSSYDIQRKLHSINKQLTTLDVSDNLTSKVKSRSDKKAVDDVKDVKKETNIDKASIRHETIGQNLRKTSPDVLFVKPRYKDSPASMTHINSKFY
uniref:C2H2-type domain-containing protein n=1 Tax=Rhabditophanes sp. KR3021 TaxID=114890 RepID=A0AC35TJZ2_9BILA